MASGTMRRPREPIEASTWFEIAPEMASKASWSLPGTPAVMWARRGSRRR